MIKLFCLKCFYSDVSKWMHENDLASIPQCYALSSTPDNQKPSGIRQLSGYQAAPRLARISDQARIVLEHVRSVYSQTDI